MIKPNPDDYFSAVKSYELVEEHVRTRSEPPFRGSWKIACLDLLDKEKDRLKAVLVEPKTGIP